MKPARIVFPGFWFGQSDLALAKKAAQRGVGGFCVYGGSAQETADFIAAMREASPYDHILICADISEDLSEVIKDAPKLPSNAKLGTDSTTYNDGAYRKGLINARLARSIGIDWLFSPVVDLGYQSPCFGEEAQQVARDCEDYAAGLANGGVLNCLKSFPGVSGILKPLSQLEEAEFVPYKHLFRLADGVILSDMVFSNLDAANRAMMSERVVRELLKKRLNYKGGILGSPLFRSHIKNEHAAVLQMIACGVDFIVAPLDTKSALGTVEKACDQGKICDSVVHAVSHLELLISKVTSAVVSQLSWKEAVEQAQEFNK